MVLFRDLRFLVASFIPLKVWQYWYSPEILSPHILATILDQRGLSPAAVLENNPVYTSFQCFTRELFYHGDIGWECQLYASIYSCLLAALRNNDVELVKYYFERYSESSTEMRVLIQFGGEHCFEGAKIIASRYNHISPKISVGESILKNVSKIDEVMLNRLSNIDDVIKAIEVYLTPIILQNKIDHLNSLRSKVISKSVRAILNEICGQYSGYPIPQNDGLIRLLIALGSPKAAYLPYPAGDILPSEIIYSTRMIHKIPERIRSVDSFITGYLLVEPKPGDPYFRVYDKIQPSNLTFVVTDPESAEFLSHTQISHFYARRQH